MNIWDGLVQESCKDEPAEGGDPTDVYFDEKTGHELDAKLVQEARREELDFMSKIGLFKEATVEECIEHTGKPPISTKWVDVNKGSAEVPEVRCRLVARDFKPKGERDRADLFAAMPPLEAKKLRFRLATVTLQPGEE